MCFSTIFFLLHFAAGQRENNKCTQKCSDVSKFEKNLGFPNQAHFEIIGRPCFSVRSMNRKRIFSRGKPFCTIKNTDGFRAVNKNVLNVLIMFPAPQRHINTCLPGK